MTLATVPPPTNQRDLTRYVLSRISELRHQNQELMAQRSRIRAIMNGGPNGLRALIGPNVKIKDADVPAANLMLSGMERAAQSLQDPPDLRAPTPDADVSQTERDRMVKRNRIVRFYDYLDRIDLQTPQVGRWIQGYGFVVWKIRERVTPDGHKYPQAELRDPYMCWPGHWGVSQQPAEAAFQRIIPVGDLVRIYPQLADSLRERTVGWVKTQGGGYILGKEGRTWEGTGNGVEVVEYVNDQGTFIAVPEVKMVVDFIPNPLRHGPPMVFAKRFSFDQLIGQFDHVLGLMAMMAKLNVLALIQATDAVFQETNVIGDMVSKKYKVGRGQVNFFTPGTRIEKGQATIAFQVFQEIDRLERQLRITQNYPVSADGISPMSFTTGEGVRELASASGAMTKEYQKALRWGFQDIDSKRLEWDEVVYGDSPKPYLVLNGKSDASEIYRPSRDINGVWRTRRIYGLMAGWDEPSKLIGGLQLKTGNIIDTQTMQYNLSGLADEDIPEINKRIAQEQTWEQMYAVLVQQAAPQAPGVPGDQRAMAALVEIALSGEREKVLEKYFRPEDEGENPSEAEQQMLQQQALGQLGGGGAPGGPEGAPPPVQTVLSQLGGGGAAEGGAQIVART